MHKTAQITQWDLIFYGTEIPAQPDDPVQISPGQFGSFGSDIEHNLLEYDTDSASGQWRNMQQVCITIIIYLPQRLPHFSFNTATLQHIVR